ncbi:FAD-binding protein [Occultella kanbiaonis]|uniref:FAD-binding protein n=1 Tax=Occultella kanbiaonis TaxID=2675754 RepID=UPI0013D8C337|nr:FAD-binding protein [Occultella kanbiaonis]
MSTEFDHTYDVVVVGSGAAGFAAALGAVDEGLSVLILESTDQWGGSTSMSGGGLWMPNNPLMQRDGVGDSREDALTYLEQTVGQVSRSTSPAHREAFVDGVADLVLTTEKHGFRWARATDYPDYYPELPGGKIGRGIEVEPFDGKLLGELAKSQRVLMPVPIKTDDVWLLGRAWSTAAGFVRGAQLAFRTLGGLVTGKRLQGIGAGLAGAYCKAVVVDGGGHLWLNASVEELVVSGERVVGVRAKRDGRDVSIGAGRGVVLAGGGFDHNLDLRRRYQGIEAEYSSGNPGNIGTALALAEQVGAATELLDEAWWGGSIAPVEGGDPSFIVGERSLPYSIIVDALGARFANEAESYVDLGHHMLAHDGDGPYWFILDARHTRRYLRTFALDPRVNKAAKEQGIVVKADTLEELTAKLGLDAATFRSTVQRFNGFARSGKDQDFHRGDSAYDRYYGDPTVRPNPCLGPIEKGPFTAYQVVLGDLGTKGGALTDPDARVLREDGSVIAGLYAAGNNAASVMGRTYPGPGSTIGPASVFGLRAARHLAGRGQGQSTGEALATTGRH